MLTPKNRENLEKLGRHLALLNTKYQREHFNMADFFRHDDCWVDPKEIDPVIKDCFCGSVACAVGHAPIVLPVEFNAIDWLNIPMHHYWDCVRPMDEWLYVTMTLFGRDFANDENNGGTNLFDFCFGGQWANKYDEYLRTSWAAADRIAYLLDEEETLTSQLQQTQTYMYENDIPFIGYALKNGWITKAQHTYRINSAKKGLVNA